MTFKNKIVSADEAIAIVRDNDTVCISGFVGIGTPDELILALERRFMKERHPSALTLMFAAAPGDGKDRGLNRLAHKGLLKRMRRCGRAAAIRLSRSCPRAA
jgi:propionate CoA-transferase